MAARALKVSPYSKSYKNTKTMERAIADLNLKGDWVYIVHTGEDSRLRPIFVLSEDQVQEGLFLAHHGFQILCR